MIFLSKSSDSSASRGIPHGFVIDWWTSDSWVFEDIRFFCLGGSNFVAFDCMGDLRVSLPQNGVLTEETQSPSNPHPLSIGAYSWSIAEKTTRKIIFRIQPTVGSEQRRKAVVDYVQRLIRRYIGSDGEVQVFPFGSVPLKTYLPDGDIDLTALSYQNVEDALANDVRSVLEGEEQNKDAEFEVKDVQYIHAEVKLVKCLVQNIVVDISFNQLGGLCTLCFLEMVDRFIGKDHLFKRSIILIKAWCYYESRILGAHHGLISTYALETLVLYIFHLFHASLHGPLAVLYRFLDYFSKFDWDNYGISLNGPFTVSSLPEIAAETPENNGGDLLLDKVFLRNCVGSFSVPSKGLENHTRSFPQKHLNIVDPLKENNNLGRSVSKGNFYRIRSAFTYGARKLGRILMLSGESMEDELNKFFLNTLEGHGSGQRPDVLDSLPIYQDSNPFGVYGLGSASSKSNVDKCMDGKTVSGLPSVDSLGSMGKTMDGGHGVLCEEINCMKISGSEKKHETGIQMERHFSNHQPIGNEQSGSEKKQSTGIQLERHFSNHQLIGNELQTFANLGHLSTMAEPVFSMEENVVSCCRLSGDAKDLASSHISSSRVTNELCKSSTPGNELGSFSFGRAHHAPHLYFSRPFQEIEKVGNGNLDQTKLVDSTIPENRVSSGPQAPGEQPHDGRKCAGDNTLQSRGNHVGPAAVSSTGSLLVLGSDVYPSETLHHVNGSLNCEPSGGGISNASFRERDLEGASGNNSEASNSLSELTGDYDSFVNSLLYGRRCHESILYGQFLPFHMQSASQYHNKSSWDAHHRSTQLKQSMFPHMNANAVIPGPLFPNASFYHPVNSSFISGAFGVEEMPKTRGTGTYFPNMNHLSYRERPMGRGRNSVPIAPYQFPRSRNGRVVTSPDAMNLPDRGSHEPQPHSPAAQLQFFGVNGRGKSIPTDFIPSSHTVERGFPHANGCALPTERFEFGSFAPVPSSEQGMQRDSAPLQHVDGSGSMLPMSTMQRPGPNLNQERAPQSYHLKDEDFPPLSV